MSQRKRKEWPDHKEGEWIWRFIKEQVIKEQGIKEQGNQDLDRLCLYWDGLTHKISRNCQEIVKKLSIHCFHGSLETNKRLSRKEMENQLIQEYIIK